MACGEEMRLVQAVADQTMAVPGFEQHLFRCPGCHDTERRLVFIHPDDPAPRVQPISEADLAAVSLQPEPASPGEHDAPPVAQATPDEAAQATPAEPAEPPAPSRARLRLERKLASKGDPADAEQRPSAAWQQSVERHRTRWSALCERLGLQIATDGFFRKDKA
jgi:hypothetical protein